MTIVFADTLYWIALINARDQWHERAVAIKTTLAGSSLVTTESVLLEMAIGQRKFGRPDEVRELSSQMPTDSGA